ncbi:MAG: hypothetical protein ACSLFE_03500, partial [Gemmatimonadaceae bacterium]
GEKSGIEVREVDRHREGPDPREPLWELNAAAAGYFSRMLWDDPLGSAAREYLERRGISREIATQAELGWAPGDQALMRQYLGSLGFDDARLLEVGLILQREESGELRTRFRNRLMFPIRDAGGRHVGFGGRVLGTGEPKYLNSPDSPAFTKGRLLYGAALGTERHTPRGPRTRRRGLFRCDRPDRGGGCDGCRAARHRAHR